MRFRFRAQAALDLRTRALEQAQRELARAEALRDAATRRVADADAAAARAREAATEAQRTARETTGLEWYRFWILRLTHERAAHAKALAAREQDVGRAVVACVAARQRRESLERFKEKARAAHAAAQHTAETKLIDELATRRFAAQRLASSWRT
jgi:flagellar export protein FliJ